MKHILSLILLFNLSFSYLHVKTKTITSSNLQANNIFLRTDTLNLDIDNDLNIESLKDSYKSNNKAKSISAGIGFGSGTKSTNRFPSLNTSGKVSSINAGVSNSKGTSLTKQTVLTSITANKINANIKGNTNIEGALFASGEFNKDGTFIDNEQLNLNTNTLTFENSSNSIYSNQKSIGADANYNLANIKPNNKQQAQNGFKGISSIGANLSNNINGKVSKTLATLGKGDIIIHNKQKSDDITTLNQDTTKLNKQLYSSEVGVNVDASLDTRLLSEEGRKDIKNDYNTATAITKSINQIATTNKAKLTDFFKETDKNVKVYEKMKEVISNDKVLSQQLQDPNLTPNQKQDMLNKITLNVMQTLGYVSNDVKLIHTDTNGKNNTLIKGHYNPKTQTSYINDKYNKSTKDLISSSGHEITHDMDKQAGIFISNDKDQNIYADNFGNDLADYTNKALDIVDSSSIASINNHNNKNSNLIKINNEEFKRIDKSIGDDRQLHRDEIIFIKDKVQDFKSKYKHKTIEGDYKQYDNEKALKLLNIAGKYLVDDLENTKVEHGKIMVWWSNEFSKEEVIQAANYLKEQSKGKKFIDVYYEDMKSQDFFTATDKQYKDPYYNPSETIGLVDVSLDVIPAGGLALKAPIENVGKGVVEGVVNQVGKVKNNSVLNKLKESIESSPSGHISKVKINENAIELKPTNNLQKELIGDIVGSGDKVKNNGLGKIDNNIYDPKKVRKDLEDKYGTENVSSTTISKKPKQTVNDTPNIKVITDNYGNKAVITEYKDPLTGKITKANIPYNNRGLPIFDDVAKYTTKIEKPKGWQNMTSKKVRDLEMRAATRDLREKINSGKIDKNQFTKEQLSDIKKGKAQIDDYTWHHNADSNNMQLVPKEVHKSTLHTGENALSKGI